MILFEGGHVTPQAISGDIYAIRFRGEGEARFRLQHTRDVNGEPDALGWCEVSGLSFPRATLETMVQDDMVRGLMVDRVSGSVEVSYQRFRAQWIRLIPFDTADKRLVAACKSYRVELEEA